MLTGKTGEKEKVFWQKALEHIGIQPETAEDGRLEINADQLRELVNWSRRSGHREGRDAQQARVDQQLLYFQQLMNLLPDYVYFKDMQSRIVVNNLAHARHLGLNTPADAVGKSDFDFFQKAFAEAKYRDEQEIIRTGKGWYFKEEHQFQQTGEEQWTLSTKLPLHDENGEICGTFGLSRNITDKKRAEIELERQKALLDTIVQILPCRVFVRDTAGRYLLINEEYRRLIGLASREEAVGRRLSDFKSGAKVEKIEREDRKILESGQPLKNQVRFNESPLKGQRWVLTSKVPLRDSHEEVRGLVGMTLDISEQKEAEHRAQIAQAALLQKNQQMEAELLVARQLQEKLLSTGFDNHGGYRLDGRGWKVTAHYYYEPSHHLAGDFFFLIRIDDQRLGVIICDVMGHGVKAAMVTMLIRGLMLEVPQILENPAEVLSFLNQKLSSLTRESYFPRFITATYLVIDTAAGEIRLADAGHPVPMVQIDDPDGGEVGEFQLEFMGAALGLQPDSEFRFTRLALTDKTQLFLYTDGLVETENAEGEGFGVGRLKEVLAAQGHAGPRKTIEEMSRVLDAYTGESFPDDDVCMLAVEIRKKAG